MAPRAGAPSPRPRPEVACRRVAEAPTRGNPTHLLDNPQPSAANFAVYPPAQAAEVHPMDLRKLKTLIELVETSGIAELEIQEGE